MEIISKLKKSQFKDVKRLYTDFFRSINFDDLYNEKDINIFALKKTANVFENKRSSKYYFAKDNDELIGFIHAKIIDNIGLVCNVFIKENYRNTSVLINLYKSIYLWFKENNVSVVEIEVSKSNNIYKTIEGDKWQMVRDFNDASVFQRKL